jgi:tetratricopeptide (TPR) repeat protein
LHSKFQEIQMLVFRSTAITTLALATALALPIAAQGQGKQCAVDEGKPSEVARAYLAISQVANAGADTNTAEIEGKLSGAVRSLTQGNTSDNPVGHAYELGKLFTLWSMQPNVPMIVNRGRIGLSTDPTGTINLAAAVDSQFSIVEKAAPECASETIKWRSQKPWINLVNGAIGELNAGAYDSAKVHAQWSLYFNATAPYGFMVLAQVAQHQQHLDSAVTLFQRTVALARTDSTYNNVKWQSEMNLGQLAAGVVDTAKDPAVKARFAEAARTSFQALANDSTASAAFRQNAQSAMIQVSLAMGDTASAKAAYQPQLNDPTKFTFNQLIQAGVAAAHANDDDAARTLFRSAYVANPYHRDALSNLAIYEIKAQHYDSALTLVTRLNNVDPDGSNGRLSVLTYAGIAKQYAELNKDIVARYKTAKSAKLKKQLTDSAALTTDSNSVYTDLAVKANARADSMPVNVAFTEFSNVKDTVTLAGTITNNTPNEQTYNIKLEFLNTSGDVVASQTQTVGPVAGKATGHFTATVTAPGVAAFKYEPLDH